VASVTELINALPEPAEEPAADVNVPDDLRAAWSLRPVPTGWFRRLGVLATLPAKIGAAYLFHWLRGWFKDADQNQRLLAETHWRTAVRLLDSMSYLRGAVMKVGQTLAGFPDVAPAQFVETLEQLYYRAPPMHWSLLKEMVFAEFGDDPEDRFASFETKAFAAASLGQVHRARLKSGQEVAVKVQYPGIARTIRADVRNLLLLMTPARLGRDWENTKAQFDDLRLRLERETDYEQEADVQERVRRLFREEDGIVVPRVFREHSTGRVLTTDYLSGKTLDQFVATSPSQADRNEFARKITRALYRTFYAGRLLYADVHPGNFLRLDDGRLGLIDFGFVLEVDDALWEHLRQLDRAQTTGRREDRIAAIKEWHAIGDGPQDEERLHLADALSDWSWRPRYCGGEFDFGDEAEFRRGVDLMLQTVRKRYTRARARMPSIARSNSGFRSVTYRLNAKIDVTAIAEEELRATGWDRSEYARQGPTKS
jgi:predicted unusual protein kinase regulating ubiquinone biosynthesis (AarF/ABC1/UbiB family)